MFWLFFILFTIVFIVVWILVHCKYVPRHDSHVLYFSEPGSGKTMFLTRIAYRLYKKGVPVFSNYNIRFPDGGSPFMFSKSDLGVYSFPPGCVLLFDEASLNGYDNRDFKDNFRNNRSLEYFKLIRHFQNSMVWSNQGWDELDKKIRTLCSQYWLVTKLPFFSVAVRYFKRVRPRDGDDEFHDHYKPANLARLIFDPRVIQLVYRPKYGKMYDSWSVPLLPRIERVTWSDGSSR